MELGSSEWLHAALYATVAGLSHGCTEGDKVEVFAAWIDDADHLCFVYQYPYFDGVLGYRCNDDLEEDVYGDALEDPGAFGQEVADFSIGEPLGSVVERLRTDSLGVHWWGDLDEDLPTLPPSDRLREVLASLARDGEWFVTG